MLHTILVLIAILAILALPRDSIARTQSSKSAVTPRNTRFARVSGELMTKQTETNPKPVEINPPKYLIKGPIILPTIRVSIHGNTSQSSLDGPITVGKPLYIKAIIDPEIDSATLKVTVVSGAANPPTCNQSTRICD